MAWVDGSGHGDHAVLVVTMTCQHTPKPMGYIDLALWMEKKARTHEQMRCPECGRWAIWKRKARAAGRPSRTQPLTGDIGR